jgi:hypothetical protein
MQNLIKFLLTSVFCTAKSQPHYYISLNIRGNEKMKIRFYLDPETEHPHIYNHGVTEDEVADILQRPGEDRPGYKGSRVAIGKTRAGRYLRVIYVPDPVPQSLFVITAYELRGKTLKAYRRRRRRKSND